MSCMPCLFSRVSLVCPRVEGWCGHGEEKGPAAYAMFSFKPVGPYKSFQQITYSPAHRFADKYDCFCMAVGLLGAAGNGAAMPLFSIFFGDL